MICLPDFSGADFKNDDFKTSTIAYSAHKFLFDKLPFYFKAEDSYKDSLNRGILERFMSIFADEIDQTLIPYIECYLAIKDASIADEEFLNYISDTLGNPPDIFLDSNQYRNVLINILSFYKVKGSLAGYKSLFGLLGYNIEVIELDPVVGKYDSTDIYDQEFLNYNEYCETPCFDYRILITPLDISTTVIDQNIINKLVNIIAFNQPINANLTQTAIGIRISDTLNITLTEETNNITAQTIDKELYDLANLYDDPLNEYDNLTITGGGQFTG